MSSEQPTRVEVIEYRRWYLGQVKTYKRLEPKFIDDEERDDWRTEHRRFADEYQRRFGTSIEFEAAQIAGIQ